MIQDMDLKGGTTDLGSAEAAMSAFNAGQYDEIRQAVGEENMKILGRVALTNFTGGMTKTNEDAIAKEDRGHHRQKPLYVVPLSSEGSYF